ncbi:MFS transporter [Streptomyces scabiei]|uniref:MFS transporter n=1 Tax=Streptomyces scabiei TaxID=1930 RepID=UPI0036C16111
MTITFRIPASGAELVGFSYSPSMEAVLSLHVLVEPKHHPVQHAWVRAMRRLSPALKREIDVFSFAFRSYFPEFFFPQYGLLLGIAGLAEVAGALLLARIPIRRLAPVALLAWALLGVFRLPLGLATSPVVAAALLALTGLASALTDIPLIALVQQRIPDGHLAKALGLWEAGIAGALAVSPFIASTVVSLVGVRAAFVLSGAALVTLALVASTILAATTAKLPRPARRGCSGAGGDVKAAEPLR